MDDLTNENSLWEDWYQQLIRYASFRNKSVADADAWKEDYDAGKTPRQSGCDEWGS